ncbi:vitelline membrane protein Vm26Ab-like [Malaya genurostris]|uniref:vitelline membrane protein Vm26Ab-like n=1 Tax=Malaya genurostris TaxID=325434 RepID=UPI0026F3C788|nr:vitelline membrane protein Vm26Ab-like [Malaya genurostris]
MFAKVIVLAAVALACANGKPLVAAPLVAASPAVVTAQSSQFVSRNYNGIAAAYTAPLAAAYTAPVATAAYTAPLTASAYTAAYTAPVAAAYTAPFAAAAYTAPFAASAYTASPYYPYVL